MQHLTSITDIEHIIANEGKEVYRGVHFIDLEELEFNIKRFLELSKQ